MRAQHTESRRDSILHQASPRWKLAATLVIVAGTVMLPRRPDLLYWLPAGLLACGWAVSRMPVAHAVRRMLIAQVFILSVALLSAFSPATLPTALGTVVKSNLCVFAMVLLTWTTPFQQILQEMRRWRLPPIMLTNLALMYRYLPVLTEESRRMQRARASRTFGRGRRLAWHSISVILGQLFIRSAARAERIYLAMCARGWK
jgi:cobalt/nickel transport system permease protein